ncbi:hypothetical protein TthSNM11_12680 [Thermus thermophilus]|nr:hypothetical protein [Thermus thermophilus]BDG19065.1 hypothetical protein TthSNM11_12680 [Thermus thermophilus]
MNLSRRTATYRVEVVSEGKLVALFTGTVFRLGGDGDDSKLALMHPGDSYARGTT